MKKLSFLVVLFILSACFLFPQSLIRTSVEEILTSITYLNSMFPRLEGGLSESSTVSYIKSQLTSSGIRYREQLFEGLDQSHSFSRIIEADIAGRSEETLVFMIPINHPREADISRDGSANLALGLAIAREYAHRRPAVSIKLLFLGAEFGSGPEYPLGTRQFLSSFYPEHNHVFLYLNFEDIPSRIMVRPGGNGIVSPYWLIERSRSALDASGLGYLLKGNENQIYRLGLWGETPKIHHYMAAGYPALYFQSGRSGEQIGIADWLHGFFMFIDGFIGLSGDGFSGEWDKHYLFFQIQGFSVIIPEQALLLLFILALGILLAYPFVFTRRFKHYLKSLYHNFWDIPFIFGLVFLFFLAGTFLVYIIMHFKDSMTLWEKFPVSFFLVKISISLVLFSFLFGVLKKIPFSKNSTFYNASALLLLIINIFILSGRDISLGYYLLWALFWAFLFTIGKNKWLKICCLLISLFFVVKLLIDIFSAPALPLIRFLLLSPFYGNLFITSNILPFLFMLIRIDFLFRHKAIQRQKVFVQAFGSILGGLTVILLVFLVTVSPYSEQNPQIVRVREFRDLNSDELTIAVQSEAPFQNLLLAIGELGFPILSGLREYSTVVYSYDHPLSIDVEKQVFLGRETIRIAIHSTRTIETISLAFPISDPIIYDSNFPYSLFPASNSAKLHIGKSPPNPLLVEITVPVDDLNRIVLNGTLAVGENDQHFVFGQHIRPIVSREFKYEFDLRDL